MLNKEICKRCCNYQSDLIPWNEGDEMRWEKEELIWCCVSDDNTGQDRYSIRDDPPKGCRMMMEQIVLGQQQ